MMSQTVCSKCINLGVFRKRNHTRFRLRVMNTLTFFANHRPKRAPSLDYVCIAMRSMYRHILLPPTRRSSTTCESSKRSRSSTTTTTTYNRDGESETSSLFSEPDQPDVLKAKTTKFDTYIRVYCMRASGNSQIRN